METLITDAGIILLQFKTSDVEKLLARLGCHLISMKFFCERWPWLYTPSSCEMWASFPHTDSHILQRTGMEAINSSCSGDCPTHTPLPSISPLVISHNVPVESHPGFFQKGWLVLQVGKMLFYTDGCGTLYLWFCSRNSWASRGAAPASLGFMASFIRPIAISKLVPLHVVILGLVGHGWKWRPGSL